MGKQEKRITKADIGKITINNLRKHGISGPQPLRRVAELLQREPKRIKQVAAQLNIDTSQSVPRGHHLIQPSQIARISEQLEKQDAQKGSQRKRRIKP